MSEKTPQPITKFYDLLLEKNYTPQVMAEISKVLFEENGKATWDKSLRFLNILTHVVLAMYRTDDGDIISQANFADLVYTGFLAGVVYEKERNDPSYANVQPVVKENGRRRHKKAPTEYRAPDLNSNAQQTPPSVIGETVTETPA